MNWGLLYVVRNTWIILTWVWTTAEEFVSQDSLAHSISTNILTLPMLDWVDWSRISLEIYLASNISTLEIILISSINNFFDHALSIDDALRISRLSSLRYLNLEYVKFEGVRYMQALNMLPSIKRYTYRIETSTPFYSFFHMWILLHFLYLIVDLLISLIWRYLVCCSILVALNTLISA